VGQCGRVTVAPSLRRQRGRKKGFKKLLPELVDIQKLHDLTGQVAIVTGGAEGMGKEISRFLASAGATVAVADINAEGAEATAGEINQAGAAVRAYVLDVSKAESVAGVVDGVRADFGRLDILVNNAGLQDQAFLEDTSLELWEKLQAVNLRGPLLMVREFARVLRADKTGGRIVNIASMGAVHPVIGGLVAYNTTKAGLHGLTRNAAYELAKDGITVNAVMPGNVPTAGRKRSPLTPPPMDMVKRLMSPPLGRVGLPSDIANAVLFFVAPGSEWITGQALVVDGGYLNG